MKQRIGDYLLLEPLGYGSLGRTFLANHQFLKKRAILKILPEELVASADWLASFEKNVELLGKLAHPHIASIQGAFCDEGKYVLVSEAISDAVLIHQAPLSEDEILFVLRSLATALDAMHELGIAHGAIKLTNALLRKEKEGYTPFWTDFGISSLLPPSAALSRTYLYVARLLEKGGKLCLSQETYQEKGWDLPRAALLQRSFCERFFFLAPEQKMEGGVAQTDPRLSDVYSFGILAYFLLTSSLPEGAFPLPTKKNDALQYPWDEWIVSLLHPEPAMRMLGLASSLEKEVVYRRQVTALQKIKEGKKGILELQEEFALVGAEKGALRPVLRSSEMTRPSFDADPAAAFQVDSTISPYRPTSYKKELDEVTPLLSKMVVIEKTASFRGSNHGARDEMPRHQIILSPFAIDIHPVTNEQFALFLEALGGEKDVNNHDILRMRDSRIRRSGGKVVIESGYEQHPVVGVTWYGATAYAKWVGKRLPTEAEWEIAALSGKEDTTYPSGMEIDRNLANFFSSDTTPVCSYPPSDNGLYDMAGNVYEWCQDWYDYHYYDLSLQEPLNPRGPGQGVYRVLRGGCWKSSKEDLRCAHRHRNNPGVGNGAYGFRCAADVLP